MSETTIPQESPHNVLHSYSLLREGCGILCTDEWAIIELSGDDRKAWLHGQVTNDLRKIQPGTHIAFCMCTPTGQLLANCEMWVYADRFIILVPRQTLAAVLHRCESMVVMEDVQHRDLTDGLALYTIQGPETTRELGKLVQLPTLDAGEATVEGEPVILLRSNRTGLGGWDLVVPNGGTAANRLTSDFTPIDPEAFEIARIEAGIPKFGQDMNERTLPPEMGQAFEAKNISYTKGCYTGQEVLMRIHSRGHTNKTWVALVSNDPLQPGMRVSHGGREDAGVVTSAADSPRYGYIAAAMLRNEAAFNEEIVEVSTESGRVEAEVQHMPLLRVH